MHAHVCMCKVHIMHNSDFTRLPSLIPSAPWHTRNDWISHYMTSINQLLSHKFFAHKIFDVWTILYRGFPCKPHRCGESHPDFNRFGADHSEVISHLRGVFTEWLKRGYDTPHHGLYPWGLLASGSCGPSCLRQRLCPGLNRLLEDNECYVMFSLHVHVHFVYILLSPSPPFFSIFLSFSHQIIEPPPPPLHIIMSWGHVCLTTYTAWS